MYVFRWQKIMPQIGRGFWQILSIEICCVLHHMMNISTCALGMDF